MADPLGQVVTFYSYKGGVGRTFALADVAVILALQGWRVLCVDWDLEAPGLEVFFRPWLKSPTGAGLVELMAAFDGASSLPWNDHIEVVDAPDTGSRMHLLRAGLQDDTYASRVQSIDWDDLYRRGLGRALEETRIAWQGTHRLRPTA